MGLDNTAIARIAAPDLAADTLALLREHGANDDVVFLLGRLVWQGQMTECLPALVEVAGHPGRGRYARVASIRAVMSLGDAEMKDRLWETIASQSGALDRALLAELLDGAPATRRGIELLLRTLEIVAPFDQYNFTGLQQALHDFIERVPMMADAAKDHPLGALVEGLNGFLNREPFLERGECRVSEQHAWLMAPALHAVDRLVAARSNQGLAPASLAVMRNMPALRYWRDDDFSEYKSSLGQNVPRWQELNDRLYWTSIAETREALATKGRTLIDDWEVVFMGHFWGFGPADFERCLAWVRAREGDDRQVALSRCIRIYVEADRPATWEALLQEAAQGDLTLEAALKAQLEAKPSPEMERMEADHREWQRERDDRHEAQARDRADWVRELQGNPDRVRYPPGLAPGEFSHDQYHLLLSTLKDGLSLSRDGSASWRELIPEFGEAVARAYRDASVAHWRAYRPAIRSEGADRNSTPYSLIFAMAGLAIEAGENSAFAEGLTPEEAQHALRYVAWEMNGFPSWFESLFHAHPDLVLESTRTELIWELENSVAGPPIHRFVHDVFYHAPWLHAAVAPVMLDWLREHDIPNADELRFCLSILTGGGVSSDLLAALAKAKVEGSGAVEQRPRWMALWVDTDPDAAIPALETVLRTLAIGDASRFAQEFVVALLGDRHGTGNRDGAYRKARNLRALYVLMHRYIRSADDIERAGKGVYSPTLRDNAQEARNTLFNLLAATPGPEAYAAIRALEEEHPEPNYRRWMGHRARERATADADEPLWEVEQVRAFMESIAGPQADHLAPRS